MPYTYSLTTAIAASAQEIYDAWLDSLVHSAMTGSMARMSNEIGAEVSAWDGYITGRNLELIPGERIVQSWRTTQFSDENEDSIITVTLEELEDGTLLTLVHSNVPDEQTSFERGGWQEYYFEPMKEYFTDLERAASKESAKAKRTTASGKSKRTAFSKKAAGNKKSKRGIAARAKPKPAKKSANKPTRRKGRR